MPRTTAPTWTTALVTGASSGLGDVFARRLAAGGTNLVVVARRRDRLVQLADDLTGRDGVQIEVLAADLESDDDVAAVAARLADPDRPVDLLVNNAGFGYRGRFAEASPESQAGQVRVNVLALTRLAHAALGPMLQRRHGAVVNVSSAAGFQALPTMATYAATKAYVTHLSEALAEEVRGTGVRVMALCPGVTPTEFGTVAGTEGTATRLPGLLTTTPEEVVDRALADLARGRVLSVPGLHNRVLGVMSDLVPRALVRRVTGTFAARV